MAKAARFVSTLTRNTLAMVMAGGRGSRLHELTRWRAKPAVPFGGKFRIVDFRLDDSDPLVSIPDPAVSTAGTTHLITRFRFKEKNNQNQLVDETIERRIVISALVNTDKEIL